MSGLYVASNVGAYGASLNLQRNNAVLGTTLDRLSTGLRINSGKDDPAGLIASELLRSEISVSNQAIKNTQRANSLIAVADAGLSQVQTLLNDIRTLVNEGANEGGMSESQIAANQLQIDASIDSIDRIARTTVFGGKKLLDGSLDFRTSESGGNRSGAEKVSDLEIRSVNFGTENSRNIEIKVSELSRNAELAYHGNAVSGDVVVEIGGSRGSEVFMFGAGTSTAEMATAINKSSDATGIEAAVADDMKTRGTIELNGVGADNSIIVTANNLGEEAGNYTFRIVQGERNDAYVVSGPDASNPGIVEISLEGSYSAGYDDFAGLFDISLGTGSESQASSVSMSIGTANRAYYSESDSSAYGTSGDGSKSLGIDNESGARVSSFNDWNVVIGEAEKSTADFVTKTLNVAFPSDGSSIEDAIGAALKLIDSNSNGDASGISVTGNIAIGDSFSLSGGAAEGELVISYTEGATADDIVRLLNSNSNVQATLADGVDGNKLIGAVLSGNSFSEQRVSRVDDYLSNVTAAEVVDIINGKLGGLFTAELKRGEQGSGKMSYMDASVVIGDVNSDNAVRFTGMDHGPVIRMLAHDADGTAIKNQELSVSLFQPSEKDVENGYTQSVLQINLATDSKGNVTSTAADIVALFDSLSADKTGGISASLVLPAGVDPNGRVWLENECGETGVYSNCTARYGTGIVSPSRTSDPCGSVENDLRPLGDNQTIIDTYGIARVPNASPGTVIPEPPLGVSPLGTFSESFLELPENIGKALQNELMAFVTEIGDVSWNNAKIEFEIVRPGVSAPLQATGWYDIDGLSSNNNERATYAFSNIALTNTNHRVAWDSSKNTLTVSLVYFDDEHIGNGINDAVNSINARNQAFNDDLVAAKQNAADWQQTAGDTLTLRQQEYTDADANLTQKTNELAAANQAELEAKTAWEDAIAALAAAEADFADKERIRTDKQDIAEAAQIVYDDAKAKAKEAEEEAEKAKQFADEKEDELDQAKEDRDIALNVYNTLLADLEEAINDNNQTKINEINALLPDAEKDRDDTQGAFELAEQIAEDAKKEADEKREKAAEEEQKETDAHNALETASNELTAAEQDEQSAQNVVNAAESEESSKETAYNNAVTARINAESDRNTAQQEFNVATQNLNDAQDDKDAADARVAYLGGISDAEIYSPLTGLTDGGLDDLLSGLTVDRLKAAEKPITAETIIDLVNSARGEKGELHLRTQTGVDLGDENTLDLTATLVDVYDGKKASVVFNALDLTEYPDWTKGIAHDLPPDRGQSGPVAATADVVPGETFGLKKQLYFTTEVAGDTGWAGVEIRFVEGDGTVEFSDDLSVLRISLGETGISTSDLEASIKSVAAAVGMKGGLRLSDGSGRSLENSEVAVISDPDSEAYDNFIDPDHYNLFGVSLKIAGPDTSMTTPLAPSGTITDRNGNVSFPSTFDPESRPGGTSALNGITFEFTLEENADSFDPEYGILKISLKEDYNANDIETKINSVLVNFESELLAYNGSKAPLGELGRAAGCTLKGINEKTNGADLDGIFVTFNGGLSVGDSVAMRASTGTLSLNPEIGASESIAIMTLENTSALNGVSFRFTSDLSAAGFDRSSGELVVFLNNETRSINTKNNQGELQRELTEAINGAIRSDWEAIKTYTESPLQEPPRIKVDLGFGTNIEQILSIGNDGLQLRFPPNDPSEVRGSNPGSSRGVGTADPAILIKTNASGEGAAGIAFKFVQKDDMIASTDEKAFVETSYDEQSRTFTVYANTSGTKLSGIVDSNLLADALNGDVLFKKMFTAEVPVNDVSGVSKMSVGGVLFGRYVENPIVSSGGYEIVSNSGNGVASSSGISMYGNSDHAERLILRAVDSGSGNFVDVSVVSGNFRTFCPLGEESDHINGKDAVVSVNGIKAAVNGDAFEVSNTDLEISGNIARMRKGESASFTVHSGGALFQLGGDVVSMQQVNIGIKSVNSAHLGGKSGLLYQLKTGENASLKNDTKLADRIVQESIDYITKARAQLGALQSSTFEPNIAVLNDTIAELSSAEALISNADFASESSNMARAQVLIQSSMQAMQLNNQKPQYAISLIS